VLNVSKFKHFFQSKENLDEKENVKNNFNHHVEILKDFLNQTNHIGPLTRAQAKLMKYKDDMQLALQLLQEEEGRITIDSSWDQSNYRTEYKSEDDYFEKQKMMQAQWHQLKLVKERCKQWKKKPSELTQQRKGVFQTFQNAFASH
jgi:hypothetical protein